ncbi:MAG: putative Ig domain-containing protein, partial [Chthoniobacterales bacterium]
ISTAGSSIDTLLGVYTGSAVGALSAIATNDNESGSLVTSALTFNAIAGTVYRIAVDGKNAASGSVRVVVSTPPSNDAFASRLPLVGTRAIATGTNIGATKEPGEPLHAGNSGGKSVWWTWMAAGVGPVEIHTNGSDFDTTLGVYTGGSVSGLTLVAGDDDSGDDVASRVVFTPSPGTVYQIAVDGFSGDDGAIQLSVVQSVLNSPPSVTDAVVTPAPLAWSDQEVQVTSVSSFDPEGDAVTLAYQWQFSADGTVFADASGATSARLPAVSSNLGKRWRCRITPSDGVSNGLPFVTQPVDIDRRPIQIGKVGLPYFYDSDLFVPGSFESFPRSAIINEFSQGPSGGSAEWIEILFLRSSDARGWTLRDMNSANSVTFNATSSVWQSIPAGTLLVIYNGGSKDPVLPLDDADASDGVLVLSSSSAPHFSGSWPILSNSNADGFAVRDLGGSLVDGVSINGQTSFQPALGTVSGARSARFNGDTEPSVELATAWTITSSANGSVSPGRGNAVSNSQFVTRLRQGDFDTPAVFALAQDSDTVPGLTINATTGVLSGVPSAPGLYQIGITRQRASASASSSFGLLIGSPEAAFIIPNGETLQLIGPASIPGSLRVDGTLSTQGFGLTISQTFESWLALHGNPGDDGDGLPLFLEYAFDLYPSAPDENGHSTLRVEGDTARFSFRRQMAPSDLQYVIESSSNLADWGPANVSGWTLLPAEPLGIDTERVTYEFPFDVAQPLFLRIRVLR